MGSIVRISARCDYAIRAMLELAVADGGMVKADLISQAQAIPRSFLENILIGLRRDGLIHSRRGSNGGHRLAYPAEAISLAQIIDAIERSKPYDVHLEATPEAGVAPHDLVLESVRSNVHRMFEGITLADLLATEASTSPSRPALEKLPRQPRPIA